MKKLMTSLLLSAVVLVGCEKNENGNYDRLNTVQDSVAYAIGASSVTGLTSQIKNINTAAVIAGLEDFGSEDACLDEAMSRQLQQGFIQTLQQSMYQENQKRAEAMQKGESYDMQVFSLEPGEFKAGDKDLLTYQDSISYAFGTTMAVQVRNLAGEEINTSYVAQGMKDQLDSISKFDMNTCSTIIGNYMTAKQAADNEELYKEVKESGEAFLEEMKNKPGVQSTASGLLYEIIEEGSDVRPSGPTSVVTVHYTGTTPEGVEFDSSVGKDPATFGLNRVIPGWTEGVQLMGKGSKYKFYIPQELAYGANPRPGSPIKPYMPLVFEIELIEIDE